MYSLDKHIASNPKCVDNTNTNIKRKAILQKTTKMDDTERIPAPSRHKKNFSAANKEYLYVSLLNVCNQIAILEGQEQTTAKPWLRDNHI